MCLCPSSANLLLPPSSRSHLKTLLNKLARQHTDSTLPTVTRTDRLLTLTTCLPTLTLTALHRFCWATPILQPSLAGSLAPSSSVSVASAAVSVAGGDDGDGGGGGGGDPLCT